MKLLSQTEVADLLGVSIDTVKRLRKSKKIQSVYVGRSVRIPNDSLLLYIEEQKWQRENRHAWSQIGKATTTFTTQPMAEARERACGRMIYQQQKLVSQGGLSNTTRK